MRGLLKIWRVLASVAEALSDFPLHPTPHKPLCNFGPNQFCLSPSSLINLTVILGPAILSPYPFEPLTCSQINILCSRGRFTFHCQLYSCTCHFSYDNHVISHSSDHNQSSKMLFRPQNFLFSPPIVSFQFFCSLD